MSQVLKQEYTRDVYQWISAILFKYGMARGYLLARKTATEHISNSDLNLKSDELLCGWDCDPRYNHMTFHIQASPTASDGLLSLARNRINAFEIKFRRMDYPRSDITYIVEMVEAIVISAFPDIQFGWSIKRCVSPINCNQKSWFDGTREGVDQSLMLQKYGGQWLCEDCCKRFSLNSPFSDPEPVTESPDPYKTAAKSLERAKMTPTLRFKILERDHFTCKACGRSPMIDDVTLHVDHILPIAKGGKTEESNLQTLCKDCNMGKRDKIVQLMLF